MNTFVIGVTGGIGSGKTAVTDFFATKGITVVDADIAARVVVEPGRPALAAITEQHGKGILLENGSLNRRALRDIIFNDPGEKIWLENLLHPLINQHIELELSASTSPYTTLVSPLLIETVQHRMTHRILVVDIPVELQVKRIMKRDHLSENQVLAIIRQQASREQRLEKSDDVVDNSESIKRLYQQLEKLHQNYLNLASQNES